MSDNLSNIRLDSLSSESLISEHGGVYSDEERAQLVKDLGKMTKNQLLIAFAVKRIDKERKLSIIDRIINEISYDEIQQSLCDTREDGRYLLREKCFEEEIPFEDKDTIDVLKEKIENHVKRDYGRYTYDQLRELGMAELKALMEFHYLNICVHDTAEHLRRILDLFYTSTTGKIRKMLYEGFVYYTGGFKNSMLEQVNFIINGIKEKSGTIANAKLAEIYKICENKMTINRWLKRDIFDLNVWKPFNKHTNIYATKEGSIMNLSSEKMTPYIGTTVHPKDHDLEKNNYCYIGINNINYKCHQIIASIYCENNNPIKNTIVNHKDGRRNNNHWTNLEWTDHIGNANNKCSKAKTTALNQLDEDGNIIRQFGSTIEAAKEIGIMRKYISDCLNNKQKCTKKDGVKLFFEYATPKVKHDVTDTFKYTYIGYMPTVEGEKASPDNTYNYHVSHDENVKIISGKTKCELKPAIRNGYECFTLHSSGSLSRNFYKHCLIHFSLNDRSFIPVKGMHINHKNEKKRCNVRENLEVVTGQKNTAYAVGKSTYRYLKNQTNGMFMDEVKYDSRREAARSVLNLTLLKEVAITIQIKNSLNFKCEIFGFYWSEIPLTEFIKISSS